MADTLLAAIRAARDLNSFGHSSLTLRKDEEDDEDWDDDDEDWDDDWDDEDWEEEEDGDEAEDD